MNFDDLIEKADSIGEDKDEYQLKGPRREGLVPKKVTVNRNGQTFEQTVYVDPKGEDKTPKEPKKTEKPDQNRSSKTNTSKTEEPRVKGLREVAEILASNLSVEAPAEKLTAVEDKTKLKKVRQKGKAGNLLIDKPGKRLPHIDINTATTREVQTASNKLIGQLIDRMEGDQRGTFFKSTLDKHFAQSKLLSAEDRKWIDGLIATNKHGTAATASDQLTLIYKERKRLENKQRVNPSKANLIKLKKIASIQDEMRRTVAGSIYDNLNLNKKGQASLKASFAKGDVEATIQVAKDAAPLIRRFIPQELIKRAPLRFTKSNNAKTSYDYKTSSIQVGSNASKGDILRNYGKQLEAVDPNAKRLMQEYVTQKAPGSKIVDVSKFDRRYEPGTYARLGGGFKQPELGKLFTNAAGSSEKLSVVTHAMRSKKAFTELYTQEPNLVKIALGYLYGSRSSTPKAPKGSAFNQEKADRIHSRFVNAAAKRSGVALSDDPKQKASATADVFRNGRGAPDFIKTLRESNKNIRDVITKTLRSFNKPQDIPPKQQKRIVTGQYKRLTSADTEKVRQAVSQAVKQVNRFSRGRDS